jgi:hypothetical protein
VNEVKARVSMKNIFNRCKLISSAIELNMLFSNKTVIIQGLEELIFEAEKLLEDLKE